MATAMQMADLNGSLPIPGEFLGIIETSAEKAGVLARLTPERPTRFGPVSAAMWTGTPRASIVGEGDPKPSTKIGLQAVKAEPLKIVLQTRVSSEFKWADDDYRLGVLNGVFAKFGEGMGRAVDLIAFHGLDPASGTVSSKVGTYFDKTALTVNIPASPDPAKGETSAAIVAAAGLVHAGNHVPTGVAMAPAYGFGLAQETYADGRLRNPGITLGGEASNIQGLPLVTGSTVAGGVEIPADNKTVGYVGEFSQVRWGYQRNMVMETIEYGDPDVAGRDLKGHNEILIRAEAVLYVLVPDLTAIAKIVKAA